MPYKNRQEHLAAMRRWYHEHAHEPEFKSSRAAYKAKYYWEHREQLLEYGRRYRARQKKANK
jgi:hypothetical protein